MAQFFDFLNRMIAGKPVFEDEQHHDVPEAPPANTPDPVASQPSIRKQESHTFPVVEINRVTTHAADKNIQIYCHIKNTWEQEVMLDKIRLLDTTRELDTFLRAGEDREFLVYSGPKLQRESREAQLDYKTTQGGDYFRAVYEVTFTYQPADKTYTVNDLKLRSPIRDIYE